MWSFEKKEIFSADYKYKYGVVFEFPASGYQVFYKIWGGGVSILIINTQSLRLLVP